MAYDGNGSVVSGCCGEELFRDRARTVPFEAHDALAEFADDPRVIAREAELRRVERERI